MKSSQNIISVKGNRKMKENQLVLGYIGNGKSTNRYHIPFVLQRPDKFFIKTIFDICIRHDIWKRIDGIHYS